MRAALTTMKGALVRLLQSWSRRAATSLPTPAGPVIRTRLPVLATRFRVARTALIATLEPVSSVSWPIWALRWHFRAEAGRSRWRGRRDGARCPASNGFSMKSTAPWRIAATAVSRLPWPGDHQHRQRRVAALDLLEQLEPVELRALEPDVEQDQRRPPVGQRRPAPRCCWRRSGRIAFVLEHPGNEVANVLFVVDDEYVEGHV